MRGKKRSKYSRDFKIEAVGLVTEQGYSFRGACPKPVPPTLTAVSRFRTDEA